MKIFMENRHKIAKHNAAYEKGNKKFKLALNKYGDMVNMNSESHVLLVVCDTLSQWSESLKCCYGLVCKYWQSNNVDLKLSKKPSRF